MTAGPDSSPPTGYVHPRYAASLAEFGEPRELPRSGGWILVREIPGTPYRDAMGPYPLFSCRDWGALGRDLEDLRGELVSVTLVADPFGAHDPPLLEAAFDRVVRYKDHYVADLRLPRDEIVKRSHRNTVRRAARTVSVRVLPEPARALDRWCDLYRVLCERHRIRGVRAFSRASFAAQFAVPGLVVFEASADGEPVGMDLWYRQGEVAHGHLVAMSERGYALRASYATKWAVLETFTGEVRWLNFGGAAGGGEDANGLTAFKSGWSTGTRPAYLCGRILRPEAYRELARASGAGGAEYFPAYREGESG